MVLRTIQGYDGVGILVDEDLGGWGVEIRRTSGRLMMIKLVIGKLIVNVFNAFAPQVGLDEEVKKLFGRIWKR